MAPKRVAANQILTGRHVYPAEGVKRQRVALLAGCAQQVLRPSINQSTIRVLNRLGCDVVVVNGEGCCGGALVHHLGEESASRDRARALIKAWEQEQNKEGLDAIIVNTSGCGSHVKDFGHLLKDDDEWRAPAMRVASLTKDVSEIIDELGLPKTWRCRRWCPDCLSCALYPLTRPKNRHTSRTLARTGGVCGDAREGETFLLWVCRHLQPCPA